jgi:hypothetical protein
MESKVGSLQVQQLTQIHAFTDLFTDLLLSLSELVHLHHKGLVEHERVCLFGRITSLSSSARSLFFSALGKLQGTGE